MPQAIINKIYSSLKDLKSYRSVSQFYRLFLIGIILNFSINTILAQNKNSKITVDNELITNPLTVEGVSGGTINAIEITQIEKTATGYCDGFVARQPNHILKLNSFFDFLRVEVQSPADMTILIQGPGGVWCNDDSENTNPIIEGQWQPGIYKLWIGSYQPNSNNNYRIQITVENSQ